MWENKCADWPEQSRLPAPLWAPLPVRRFGCLSLPSLFLFGSNCHPSNKTCNKGAEWIKGNLYNPKIKSKREKWLSGFSKALIMILSICLFICRSGSDCCLGSLVHWVVRFLSVHLDLMPGGPEESSEVWEARRVRGANVGSTNDEGGNSLYQLITVLERSSSSKRIWATPMKHLWSMRPWSPQTIIWRHIRWSVRTNVGLWRHIKNKRMKIASYLENFTLRTFLKQQRLLIQGIKCFPCNLGFLFGFARSVFQQIDLDIGSCEEQM